MAWRGAGIPYGASLMRNPSQNPSQRTGLHRNTLICLHRATDSQSATQQTDPRCGHKRTGQGGNPIHGVWPRGKVDRAQGGAGPGRAAQSSGPGSSGVEGGFSVGPRLCAQKFAYYTRTQIR